MGIPLKKTHIVGIALEICFVICHVSLVFCWLFGLRWMFSPRKPSLIHPWSIHTVYTHSFIYIYILCSYTHIYIYTYIFTYIYIERETHRYTNIHIYIYTCIYLLIHIFRHIHIYIYSIPDVSLIHGPKGFNAPGLVAGACWLGAPSLWRSGPGDGQNTDRSGGDAGAAIGTP